MKLLQIILLIILSPVIALNWIIYTKVTGSKLGILYVPIGWTIGKITELLISDLS